MNKPITRKELMYLIRSGKDVTKVNTSKITDMNCMFREYRSFNQDISKWNVSNVTNMRNMFFNAKSFNQDISDWNVSKVTNMNFMFCDAKSFNQNISKWDVSSIEHKLDFFINNINSSSFRASISFLYY